MAVRISTHINDGYKTLKDLVSRVDYILKINNFIIDDNKTFKNSKFLVEQMELTEIIKDSEKSKYDAIRMDIKNKTTIEFNSSTAALNGAGDPPAGPLLNSQMQF